MSELHPDAQVAVILGSGFSEFAGEAGSDIQTDFGAPSAPVRNVEHIDFTQPFPATLRRKLLHAAKRADVNCHDGGVYAAMQGPRLETAAEVDRLERDGADYVGMTAMPEAYFSNEAKS